jgi:hypothetical protein
MDRRFIRRFCLHFFVSVNHPVQLEYGPSDHPTVPVDLSLPQSNYTDTHF